MGLQLQTSGEIRLAVQLRISRGRGLVECLCRTTWGRRERDRRRLLRQNGYVRRRSSCRHRARDPADLQRHVLWPVGGGPGRCPVCMLGHGLGSASGVTNTGIYPHRCAAKNAAQFFRRWSMSGTSTNSFVCQRIADRRRAPCSSDGDVDRCRHERLRWLANSAIELRHSPSRPCDLVACGSSNNLLAMNMVEPVFRARAGAGFRKPLVA